MIRFGAVGHVLGQFLMAFSVTMAFPLAYGLWVGDPEWLPVAMGLAAAMAAGLVLRFVSSSSDRALNHREGLLVVVATWCAIGVFGAIPFAVSPYYPTFTDALFEAVSGYTATGATVLGDIDGLPPGLQFYRCFSHWLGGMGVVLLAVAILPLVGHGGMHLYRAEFSGSSSEKLKPRITETAFALWKIYFALSVAAYVSFRVVGMNNLDALCHTFSVIGTGGFSSKTASMAAFNSPAAEYVAVVFMLLGGMSFVLHYRLWVERQPRRFFSDVEWRAYLAIVAVATLVISVDLVRAHQYEIELGFRSALFQVSAIMTTTGLVTDDYEAWSPLPQLILLVIMFIGGCTGSTSGGLKVSRFLLLGKVVDREFRRMVEHRGVFAVRLGGVVIPERTIQSLLNLFYLALFIYFASALALAALGVDVLTSIAAVAASMFNIGPGLGEVGPLDNYAGLPAAAKWILSLCMIAGRLEYYTVLVILTPAFWRK